MQFNKNVLMLVSTVAIFLGAIRTAFACDPNKDGDCPEIMPERSQSMKKSTDAITEHLMASIHEALDPRPMAMANGILTRSMFQILASVRDAEVPHELTVYGDENIRLVLFWARMYAFANKQYTQVKQDICDLHYVIDCINQIIQSRDDSIKERVGIVFGNLIDGDLSIEDLGLSGIDFDDGPGGLNGLNALNGPNGFGFSLNGFNAPNGLGGGGGGGGGLGTPAPTTATTTTTPSPIMSPTSAPTQSTTTTTQSPVPAPTMATTLSPVIAPTMATTTTTQSPVPSPATTTTTQSPVPAPTMATTSSPTVNPE